jgi:hypothetical protein
MLGRHKLLILIPAILLTVIFLGMIPLNMAHRLASGGPFTHCQQAQLKNNCLFNSVISHEDPIIVNLNVAPLEQESTPSFEIKVLGPDSTISNIAFDSVPLRC